MAAASHGELSALGLSVDAILRTFFGSAAGAPELPLFRGVPDWVRPYITREYRGCSATFDCIAAGVLQFPDPWTGQPVAPTAAFTSRSQGSLHADMLPLYYHCRTAGGREFWVCMWNTYGRPTHIYIPSARCFIWDMSLPLAESVAESLIETMDVLRPVRGAGHQDACHSRIGLIDMVENFGHQMINCLSGVQRLIDLGQADKLDEIWICGSEFFGPTEKIFGELRCRIRRIPHRWDLFDKLAAKRHTRLFKLGSSIFQGRLRHRILRQCPRVVATSPERPRLVVTVREAERRCVNLPEVVGEVYRLLAGRIPNLSIVLDGWVFAQSAIVARSSVATAISDRNLPIIRLEMATALLIEAALPADVLVDNLIGTSMCQSIAQLGRVDAYLSHVGTLQHKLSFLAGAGGVVHGPSGQMTDHESGPYQSEVGRSPCYLPAAAVEDCPAEAGRGSRSFDYRIVDIAAVASRLQEVFAPSRL